MKRNYVECGNIATTEQIEAVRYYRYSMDSLLFIAGVTEVEQKIGHRLSVVPLDECENRNEPAFIAYHDGEFTLFVAADSGLLNSHEVAYSEETLREIETEALYQICIEHLPTFTLGRWDIHTIMMRAGYNDIQEFYGFLDAIFPVLMEKALDSRLIGFFSATVDHYDGHGFDFHYDADWNDLYPLEELIETLIVNQIRLENRSRINARRYGWMRDWGTLPGVNPQTCETIIFPWHFV